MRTTLSVFTLAALVAGLVATNASADKKEEGTKKAKFAATCPVSGKAAIETSKSKYLGKDVFFCCNNCPKAFAKTPKKFDAKAKAQFLETKQITQVACPLTGRKVNASATVALGKTNVAFCCNNCKGKATKSTALATLVFKDFDKGFTLQTTCPVSGKAIDISKVAKHKGKNVFFCCGNCPGAFAKTPDKFVGKLPQFAKVDKKTTDKK
jgi:YHS domain-containing protein